MFTSKEEATREKSMRHAKSAVNDASAALDEIRSDLNSLKGNVNGLARHISEAGTVKAHEAAVYMQNGVDSMKASGTETLDRVETRIKESPGQSVALAFFAGAVASYLFGRRSS